jgi:Uma2 family endonuclease
MVAQTTPAPIAPETPPAETAQPEQLITGEALYKMGDIGPSELVQGRIVHLMPTGHLHGFIEVNIGRILGNYVYEHKLGRILGGEVGIYTGRNPDTVRAADVAFISTERFAQVQSNSYLDIAPELIVEVLSPDDGWSTVNQKLEEYFNIEVKLVWLVDPQRECVHVYTSLTTVEILGLDDTLTGGKVLPEFAVTIEEIFED